MYYEILQKNYIIAYSGVPATEVSLIIQADSEMVKGHTGTFTMRLVRSKLRKRDESRSEYTNGEVKDHQDREDDYPAPKNFENSETQANKTCNTFIKDNQHVTFLRTSGVTAEVVEHADVTENPEWTFPPKAPVPHIYHINQVRFCLKKNIYIWSIY